MLSENAMRGNRANLAAAHAEAGDFDEAVMEQKKVLETKNLGKADLERHEKRLELYLAKKAYHVTD